MKASSLFSGFALAAVLSSAVLAHVGETQFVPQVPDPAKMKIDGKDDDWGWMDPSFAFTSDKMIKGGAVPDFTREDFDAAYFMAWSASPDNNFYMFARVTDDTLDVNEDNPDWWWADDSFNLAVDADHSGGNIVGTELAHINNGQRWQVRIFPAPAGAENDEYGTTGMYHGPSIYQGLPQLAWGHLPPYGAFASTISPAGSVHAATNVTYTYELKMGLWDFYGLSPAESRRHIFKADEIMHLQTMFGDTDLINERNSNGWDRTLTVGGNHANSDELLDHVMVPTEGAVTAVENATWGRIKNHMEGRLSR